MNAQQVSFSSRSQMERINAFKLGKDLGPRALKSAADLLIDRNLLEPAESEWIAMSDFLNHLKEDVEKGGEEIKDVWDHAKESFEADAAAENAELDSYHDLFAWADGSLLALPFDEKEISQKDQEMRTLAVMAVKDQSICAPADGVIESIDLPQNTIVIKTSPVNTLAIKVCVSTVSFEKDATILVHPGQDVQAGQPLVRFAHPIEAKSKLMLVEPKTFADFKGAGYVPNHEPGVIGRNEIIITTQPKAKVYKE